MAMELGEFGRFLGGLVAEHEVVMHELLDRGCQIIETEAKRVIGTYEYGWPALADSTRADRERKGFPEDEPLLRSGGMRDSIGHTVEPDAGYVGSNDPKVRWQELGTKHIPARSFLAGAALTKGQEVAEYLGMGYASSLFGGKLPNVLR